jgi:hypothetical protein
MGITTLPRPREGTWLWLAKVLSAVAPPTTRFYRRDEQARPDDDQGAPRRPYTRRAGARFDFLFTHGFQFAATLIPSLSTNALKMSLSVIMPTTH